MFNSKIEEFFRNLGESKKMVFATSFQNRVSARMMSIVIFDNKFYLQTDKNFLKYLQLTNNPKVALCYENIQIEGFAQDLGKPQNFNKFLEKFSIYFQNSYNAYSFLENERLIEITPTFITIWNYKENQPIRENFYFDTKKYEEIPYIGK